MNTSTLNPDTLTGSEVLDPEGHKLGKVDGIYLDNQTSRPEWAAVKSGLFGTHVSLVPLTQADFDGNALMVPYSKEQMKGAPHQEPDRQLSQADEAELYRYYGISYGGDTVTAKTGGQQQATGTRPDRTAEAGVQGRDASGPTTDDAMTRSEEQIQVGTQTVPAGTARLRKYVVTEDVTKTVPVRHEEVRVEREPITDANRDRAMSGGDITEEEHEITLRAEKPVVQKETVPVERVRLGTETVTDEQTVNEQVRKEQIEEPHIARDKKR